MTKNSPDFVFGNVGGGGGFVNVLSPLGAAVFSARLSGGGGGAASSLGGDSSEKKPQKLPSSL